MSSKEKMMTTLKHTHIHSPVHATMSRYMTLLFAIACGMAVANIYFAHPLLDSLSNEFKISHSTIGIVITITQVCYALGLLLFVPLGDLLNQKRLIIVQMLLSVFALIVIGIAPSSTILFIGLALVGLLATVTQTLVAYASILANPAERGRIVGFVTSGVVIGILLARTFAGTLTDLAGWRSVYLTSATLLLFVSFLLHRNLPTLEQKRMTTMPYPKLIRSVLLLFVEERFLRIRGILALLIFTSFSILWTSLVLPLSATPHNLSHTAIGAFGLAGVVGALAATKAGQLADKGLGQRTTGIALSLLVLSWLLIKFINYSLLLLIFGIILLDLAVQAVHVTNQSMLFTVRPEARSRITASYMIFYSIGSATGAILSTNVYAKYGWNGVCLLGVSVSAFALLFWAMTLQQSSQLKKE
ncbi:MFS transporter [Bacillus toyonensis]|uniref:MFS transporter n=1 Tax=Bacillus toyonensis TaxID=155322 RepID=UPI000BF03D78|nr:MFS transporter [Bacillus toyonensis]MDF9450013.1 MFS transporter [Bacillus toyonensis]MDG1562773.1 MFS transporter [Bacillus toyonensis]PEO58226.1 MFS transporter [Bacillus toyonensis]PFX71708.1 MFS transporter [Bacillus toyonensis]PFX82098.1 MFS transporter [Bacillus toyonensis]